MRILKTDLKVRPIFLHNDNRVAALAYLTVRLFTLAVRESSPVSRPPP